MEIIKKILTLDLECDDTDELMGDPTSNFRCGGVEDNFELSISITLPVADEDALLRLDVFPLLKQKFELNHFYINPIQNNNKYLLLTIAITK